MQYHPPPDDPPLLAVAALDEYIAEIVQSAHQADVHVPSSLFDWAVGEGTRLVERLARQGRIDTSRCCHGVRDWAAPWIASQFPQLRPFLGR
ncbi:MAG: hypothetical protein HY854_13100 [Burkholderiales bacterium]|nr:hypothetical protein [Burkholderiales bacterium]